jgi:hypothetical protein
MDIGYPDLVSGKLFEAAASVRLSIKRGPANGNC